MAFRQTTVFPFGSEAHLKIVIWKRDDAFSNSLRIFYVPAALFGPKLDLDWAADTNEPEDLTPLVLGRKFTTKTSSRVVALRIGPKIRRILDTRVAIIKISPQFRQGCRRYARAAMIRVAAPGFPFQELKCVSSEPRSGERVPLMRAQQRYTCS